MIASALAEFQANWWLYLSMPLTSGAVGYGTNVLAIRMMFQPLEFFGIKPWFGWQGIVPSKAAKMAGVACDTLVPRLVTEKEIFEKLDPARVAQEIEEPVLELIDRLIEELMLEYEPAVWKALPQGARDLIKRRVQDDAPDVVAEVMGKLTENIDKMFDLREMVVTTLVRDKALINRIFQETGRAEFRFIGHSGFYFGFAFGLLQMIGWTVYKSDWQLPLFGLLVGYATNWIALQMIFMPQAARRIGPLVIQGLFHKRQAEVSRDYARLIADEIVTPANIIEAVLKGPAADSVFNMIGGVIKRTIDEQSGLAKPFVAWRIGTRRYREMKLVAVERLVTQLPQTIGHVEDYAREAMDLSQVLSTRLAELPPDDFEAMLRPAFQEDEWILIAVGAALGLLVGLGQLFAFKALAMAPGIAVGASVLLNSVTV